MTPIRSTHSDQCLGCKHFHVNDTCEAFPEGIPPVILTGRYDHKENYPGDQGITFEPLAVEPGPQAG
jgi:hypothetical protein